MSGTETDRRDFSIRRLSSALGVEVVGLDASKSFEPHTLQVLWDAFQEHHLLCFRDQKLGDEAMITFSKQFGPLEEFPEKDKTKDRIEVYHVANVSPEGEHLPEDDQRVIYQRNNTRWHTDSSYRYVPSFASIMYGVEVPAGGGPRLRDRVLQHARNVRGAPRGDEAQARTAAPSALLRRDPAVRTGPAADVGA